MSSNSYPYFHPGYYQHHPYHHHAAAHHAPYYHHGNHVPSNHHGQVVGNHVPSNHHGQEVGNHVPYKQTNHEDGHQVTFKHQNHVVGNYDPYNTQHQRKCEDLQKSVEKSREERRHRPGDATPQNTGGLTELEELGRLLLLSVMNHSVVTADTMYDFSLDMTESNNARYLVTRPCTSCYSFNSSLCKCGKDFYCDILCQVLLLPTFTQLSPVALVSGAEIGKKCHKKEMTLS